jgi:hypothetical protein
LNTIENAITSLAQIEVVLDILQGKKQYTNGDFVAMVLVVAEMERISEVLEQKERDLTKMAGKTAFELSIVKQISSYNFVMTFL